jgi:hypothetical protein
MSQTRTTPHHRNPIRDNLQQRRDILDLACIKPIHSATISNDLMQTESSLHHFNPWRINSDTVRDNPRSGRIKAFDSASY